jgi:hypothetical protein
MPTGVRRVKLTPDTSKQKRTEFGGKFVAEAFAFKVRGVHKS